jgi:hypothetical protein
MYTTLNHLKQSKACVPGYTRMVTFFSLHKEMKDVPIPLWMVCLTCGVDDVEWAGANSLIVDEEDYKKFYKRHLNSLLKSIYWKGFDMHRNAAYHSKDTHPLVKQAMDDMVKMDSSFEQARAFIDKYSKYQIDNWIWTNVFGNIILHHAPQFVNHVISNYNESFNLHSKNVMVLGGYPKHMQRYSRVTTSLGDEPEYADEDREQDDDENDGEELDDDGPRPVREEKRETYDEREERRNRIATEVQKTVRVFSYPGYEGQEKLAHMLCGDGDVHLAAIEWMAEHGVLRNSRVGGFDLVKDADGSFRMTFSTDNAAVMFNTYRTATARGLDLNAVIQSTDHLSDRIRESMIASGNRQTGSSRDFDTVAVGADGSIIAVEEGLSPSREEVSRAVQVIEQHRVRAECERQIRTGLESNGSNEEEQG